MTSEHNRSAVELILKDYHPSDSQNRGNSFCSMLSTIYKTRHMILRGEPNMEDGFVS